MMDFFSFNFLKKIGTTLKLKNSKKFPRGFFLLKGGYIL
jgi:hypothetical protein